MKLSKKGETNKKQRILELTIKLKESQLKTATMRDKHDFSFAGNTDYELAEQEQAVLLSLLRKEIKELESAEILEKLDLPDDIVTIGDTLTVLTKLNNDPEEMETITLVEEVDPNQLDNVTINSPLGSALYLQKVGSQLVCNIPAGTLQITILEKTKGFKR